MHTWFSCGYQGSRLHPHAWMVSALFPQLFPQSSRNFVYTETGACYIAQADQYMISWIIGVAFYQLFNGGILYQLLCCCDGTPWSEAAYGRQSLFWLVIPLGEFIKGTAAGGLSRKPIVSVNTKQRVLRWRMLESFNSQNPPPMTLPPTRLQLLNLPKQHHQLGTGCSSIWAYGDFLTQTAWEGAHVGAGAQYPISSWSLSVVVWMGMDPMNSCLWMLGL